MTKLRLGPLAEDKPVKLTVEISGVLMRDLADYASIHARLNDLSAPLPPDRLISAMVERFIASDRGFASARRRG